MTEYGREVVELLAEYGILSGWTLRLYLNAGKRLWQRWGLSDFYRLMASLEDKGLVLRKVKAGKVAGEEVRVTYFTLAPATTKESEVTT